MKSNEKLYKVLVFAGWTQDKLADYMGVATTTVNSWANERSEPKGEHAELIDELYADLVAPYVCELEQKADRWAKRLLRQQIRELPEDNVCEK